MDPIVLLTPSPAHGVVAIEPQGIGPGYWAGAPSAVALEDEVFLSYRLRRPLTKGRGGAVVVARSTDGKRFETLWSVGKEDVGAESLERPTLIRTLEGRWRLYLSCATPGTKHWRIEVTEAAHPAEFDIRHREIVLPGDEKTGVKDSVIVYRGGQWHLWASCHPLADPDEADQMTTDYATSPDGLEWTWHGTALSGTPGQWDSRGTRVTAVVYDHDKVTAFYDGRASAEENYEERTGVATGPDESTLTAIGSEPFASSPYRDGGLRYLDIVPLPTGGHRLYYEMTRRDGSHALFTEFRQPWPD